jgi:uncharacterized protein YfaA (DUF2138 family)
MKKPGLILTKLSRLFFRLVILVILASGLSLIPLDAFAAQAENFRREPDVVINTSSLFDLPKDIVSIPALKELLTEDFVFYYRDGGENWMSFRGALARIAFEKQVDWPTRLLTWVLNGPAEVALWKGLDGKLNHFVLVVDQTGVKALIKAMAEAALSDTQLASKVVDGRTVHVLTLSNEKAVYFASEGNRLYVFTDEGMPFPGTEKDRGFIEQVKSFFGANGEISVFGPKLGEARHVITAAVSYLSFGYQEFFPSLRSVRFDFSKQGWATRVLTAGPVASVEAKDWAQMPRGAAFCAALPFDTKKVDAIVHAKTWLESAARNAVICWYPESKLYTPLLALRGEYADKLKQSGELKKVFTRLIGAREAIWVREGENEETPPTLKWLPTLPVRETKGGSGRLLLTREVGARYGLYSAKSSKDVKLLGSKKFFRVALAATESALLFSPDDQLVDRALKTKDGKYPSMSASLPSAANVTSVIFAPEAFAKLAKQSILDSLPPSQEALFRSAVSRSLFPNLEKFARRPVVLGTLTPSGAGESGAATPRWSQFEWVTNASR